MEDAEVVARREAARRRLAGESPELIARDLGRTRQWVAKWAARYDPHDPGWAEGRSRAPRRVARRTGADVEAQVLEVRKRLEENPWAQVGAPAIAWELEKLGAVAPPERTIERIVARAGATKRQRPGRRQSKGIPYPAPAAKRAGEVVQVDLVGPRHLDGGVRFHALNQIDVASHHAGIEIVKDRGDQRVLMALHALWCRHGVPGRIQFDNGGPFVSPTGLGEVVRVCLRQGATPVFIPPREPWRNGTIEHFNDTFDQRFFRAERFTSVAHLAERAGAFERFHNARHRYSATRGLTPDETSSASEPRVPCALEELPTGWPKRGRVEFIRFIRSDHKLRVLGRAIPMPDGSAYQYVTATLDLALTAEEHNLVVCDDQGELLTTGRLPLPTGS
jgi:putative transposase